MSRDAVESRVGEQSVLLHLGSGTYFGLDAVGTQIWELLRQGLEPDQICERLEADYGVDSAQIEADVLRFLTLLHKHELLIIRDNSNA